MYSDGFILVYFSRCLKLWWIQFIILFQTIRWCSRKTTEFIFTGLPQSPVHSEASLLGCQYRRSSTITYNLTSTDTFTQFLCESGDTGMCGTGSAIQYVNISTGKCHILTCCEFFIHLKWLYSSLLTSVFQNLRSSIIIGKSSKSPSLDTHFKI